MRQANVRKITALAVIALAVAGCSISNGGAGHASTSGFSLAAISNRAVCHLISTAKMSAVLGLTVNNPQTPTGQSATKPSSDATCIWNTPSYHGGYASISLEIRPQDTADVALNCGPQKQGAIVNTSMAPSGGCVETNDISGLSHHGYYVIGASAGSLVNLQVTTPGVTVAQAAQLWRDAASKL